MILYVFQAGLLVYVGTQGASSSSNNDTAVFARELIETSSPATDGFDDTNRALILTSILVAVLENVALVREKSIFFFAFGISIDLILHRESGF